MQRTGWNEPVRLVLARLDTVIDGQGEITRVEKRNAPGDEPHVRPRPKHLHQIIDVRLGQVAVVVHERDENAARSARQPALRARPSPTVGSLTRRSRYDPRRCSSPTTAIVVTQEPLSTTTTSHGSAERTARAETRHRRNCIDRSRVHTTTLTAGRSCTDHSIGWTSLEHEPPAANRRSAIMGSMRGNDPSPTWISGVRRLITRKPRDLTQLGSWSAVGKWSPRYATSRPGTRPAYGGHGSYQIAGAYLSNCLTVEDWGCGHGTFRDHCTAHHYIGVDGSPSPAADRVVDLCSYRSVVEGILVRHVIEHNPNGWDQILTNAIESFSKRLVIVIFTPFGDRLRNLRSRPPSDTGVPVAMSFRFDDITALIPPTLAWFTIIGGVLDRTETMFFSTEINPLNVYTAKHRHFVYRPNWRANL